MSDGCRILLLLADGFEILEAAAFIDVFGWSNSDAAKSEELRISIGGRTRSVASSFGPSIPVDILLPEIDPLEYSALAIPGGFPECGFLDDACKEDFLAILRGFDMAKKPIASICLGAVPLARSGILAGRKATCYALDDGIWLNQLRSSGAILSRDSVVVDGHVTTSRNPASAIDVAFRLLEVLTSARNAGRTRQAMGFSSSCGAAPD